MSDDQDAFLNFNIQRAFSMVELMTVIGIIAILIAILMPVLTKARAASQSVVCKSHLHTIVEAGIMFASEHQGFIPLAGEMSGTQSTTPDGLGDPQEIHYTYFEDQGVQRPAPIEIALAPYMGSKIRLDSAADMVSDWQAPGCVARKIFTCPSQLEVPTATIITGDGDGWAAPLITTSYAYNEAVTGYIQDNDRRLRGQVSKANPSSEVLLWTDAIPRAENSFIAWFNHVPGRLTLADAFTFEDDPANYTAGDSAQFDYFRHHNRINVVFLDGHVASLGINLEDLRSALISGQ